MSVLLAVALAGAGVPAIEPLPANVWNAPPALSLDATGLPAAIDGPDGTTLPPPLARWVRARLGDYATYQGRCQARLDAAHDVAVARLREALGADAARDALNDAQLEREAASSWPTWAVVGSFALGVVAGGAAIWTAAQVVR